MTDLDPDGARMKSVPWLLSIKTERGMNPLGPLEQDGKPAGGTSNQKSGSQDDYQLNSPLTGK